MQKYLIHDFVISIWQKVLTMGGHGSIMEE